MSPEELVDWVQKTPYRTIRPPSKITVAEMQEICLHQDQDLHDTVSMLVRAQSFIEEHGLKEEYEKIKCREVRNDGENE